MKNNPIKPIKFNGLRLPTRQEMDFLLTFWGMKAVGKVS